MIEEQILQGLTDELNEKGFQAEYGDPHQGGPQIRVKGDEIRTYFVLINDEHFKIRCHSSLSCDQYNTGEYDETSYPLEHPNAVMAVFRYLDRKCSYGRHRRQDFIF